MSWQASQWAANIPHGLVGYVAFRALSLLANDAKEDGSATWLEASTVAARLDVSLRTVERAYKELRDAGMIRYGEQRHVAHLPVNRRPPVYDLTMLTKADLLAHADGSVAVELDVDHVDEAPEPAPSNLSAQPQPVDNSAPSNLSAPTTGVAVNKEEPPLRTIKTYRGNQQTRARGAHLSAVGAVCDRGHLLLEGARSCELGHYMPGVTLHSDGGSPTPEAVALAAAAGGVA